MVAMLVRRRIAAVIATAALLGIYHASATAGPPAADSANDWAGNSASVTPAASSAPAPIVLAQAAASAYSGVDPNAATPTGYTAATKQRSAPAEAGPMAYTGADPNAAASAAAARKQAASVAAGPIAYTGIDPNAPAASASQRRAAASSVAVASLSQDAPTPYALTEPNPLTPTAGAPAPPPRAVAPVPAAAPPTAVPGPLAPANGGLVVLDAGMGRVLRTQGQISSLFAADPKVVEVRPASHNSIFVFGVGPGRSTVAALNDAGDTLAQFDVVVRASTFGANESSGSVRRQVPDSSTQFSETPNSIVATGVVPNGLAAENVAATARGFLTDKQTLDNRTIMNSPVQVMLRVKIAEISRNITRQLGINWTALANFGHFNATAAIIDGLSQPTNLPNTIGLGFNDGTSSVNNLLDLLAEDQLITMLAEPNLTTRSGEVASFLAGGEYPIPTSGSNGQISVTFKQYGVSLAFVPTVLSNGRISLHVHPEVSELTNQGAVSVPIATGFLGSTSTITIPAITVRRADTTVELGSGQSFAVAGLLQGGNTLQNRGLPGIGELPVIGPLFKSDLFQRNESELVIVVTPYIVNPVSSPDQLRAPTDDYVPPGDFDRVFLNRQRARGTGPSPVVVPSSAALTQSVGIAPADLPSGVGFILH